MLCLISHDGELQLQAEGIVGYVVTSDMCCVALLFDKVICSATKNYFLYIQLILVLL